MSSKAKPCLLSSEGSMAYLQLLFILCLSFRVCGSRLLLLLLQRQRGVVGLLQRILIPAEQHPADLWIINSMHHP